jgi:hypothetical protein
VSALPPLEALTNDQPTLDAVMWPVEATFTRIVSELLQ